MEGWRAEYEKNCRNTQTEFRKSIDSMKASQNTIQGMLIVSLVLLVLNLLLSGTGGGLV